LVAHEGDFGGGEVGVGGGKEEEKKTGDGGGGFGERGERKRRASLRSSSRPMPAKMARGRVSKRKYQEIHSAWMSQRKQAAPTAPEAMTASQREACQRLWRLREKTPKARREAKLASSSVVRMGWVERVVERAIFGGVEGFFGVPGHAGEDGADGIVQPFRAHGATGELDEVIFGVFDLEEAGIDEVDEEAGGEEVGDEPAGDGGGANSGRGDF
jgi:hypothetical protein